LSPAQAAGRFGLRLAALVLLLHAACVPAATTAAPDVRAHMAAIDAWVRAEMARQGVPGVALGIRSGATVIEKGYGLANVELNVPVRAQTVFQSGSLGKQFTAVLVMLEVEAGRVALDDPLSKYFPEAPASWHTFTVRNLLNHTSGIADYTDAKIDGKPVLDYRRDYTEEEITRLTYSLPLEFAPGSRYKYSNTGYLLLGVLIHRTSGHFYGELLQQKIFAPLGMKSARIISEADIVMNRAAGYHLVQGQLKNQDWVAPSINTTADGSLYLSVPDYLAWDQGLRAQAMLKSESWAQVYAPASLTDGSHYPYGFGWDVESWHDKPWYHHEGAWQGFQTIITRYLADDLTLIVLTNLEDASPARIADGVAHLIDPALPKTEAPAQ
jgi:CubicO group peptidase (beta-lactamase class C family)